ncbi:MAG: winged helix-turn-helix domain-containing protein [Candidatus Bathycorpusculaceae bacterium]
MKKFEKYTEEITNEIRIILESLDNPVRQAILMLLSKKGELSFSDLQKELGLRKLTLNFHLKKLFASALVDHYYKHELGNQKYSYYSVTPLGGRVLLNLSRSLIPPLPFEKMRASQIFTERYGLCPYGSTSYPPFYLKGKEKEPIPVSAPSCGQTSSTFSSANLVVYSKAE